MKKYLRESAAVTLVITLVFGSLSLGFLSLTVSAIESSRGGETPIVTSEDGMPVKPALSQTARQKSCEVREAKVKAIMARLANRGQKQIELFTTIATRVQNFYTDKQLSVNGYDALVAELNAKKAIAETAVNGLKDTIPDFKCDSEMTRGAISNFKDEHKAMRDALKAYKTAVKNLIVAVKSAQASTGDGQN